MTSSPRIISLLPSATEIAAALGFRDHLVGRSHECDFPPGVEKLPICSSTKVPADGTSYEIDERVKAIVAEGLSVYRVDVDRLRELRPDFILTQTQCAVCAVTPRDLEQALCSWTGAQPAIISLEPNDLADVWNDIRRVGESLGAQDRAEKLIESLTERLAAIRDKARLAQWCPSVAAIEWLGPLMAGGNWMPELIEIAGGRSLFAKAGEHSSWLEWATGRRLQSDGYKKKGRAAAPVMLGFWLDSFREKRKPRGTKTLINPWVAVPCVKRKGLIAVLVVVMLGLGPVSAEPPAGKPPSPAKAETDSQRIAFVHLRFTGAQVQLVEFKVVPGRFKTAPEPAGERILLQVVGSSGKPLWEGWLNDPRTRVLEFSDSRQGGRRAGMAVAVPNPEVVVRVPFVEEGQALHIWSVTPAKGSGPHYQRLNTVLLREQ